MAQITKAGAQERTSALILLTSVDSAGLARELFETLAPFAITIKDVKQVVIDGRLILSVLIELLPAHAHAIETDLIERALVIDADIAIAFNENPTSNAYEEKEINHISVLSDPIKASVLADLCASLASIGVNIESISHVSSITPSLHFQISGSTFSEVRSTLSLLAREKNYEIALQNPEFLHARKMVVLDVDSTLIEQEVIELLARKAGVEDSVKEITDRAMKGELDFTQSLIARVALLKGLPEKTLSDVRAEITFTPGARDLIKTLQRLGHAVGLVTGGFIEVLEPLIEDLGIVYVKANGLEMEDGLLTGLTRGTIIDREGKASALKEFSESESIPMQHTIAIGDGANDIDMVSAAGLGIAFRAKPILCAHADTLIFQNDLGRVIDLLGIPRLN